MVEFALVVTMLALMIPAVVDFGRFFYYDVAVSAAAAEGTRAAAAGKNDSAICTMVSNSTSPGLIGNCNQIAIRDGLYQTQACSDRKASSQWPVWTSVQVTYTFTPITSYMKYFLGTTVSISRSVSQPVRVDCT